MIKGVLDMLPALHCLSHQSIIALQGLVTKSCRLTTAGLILRPCGITKGFNTCMVLTKGSDSAAKNSWALLTGAVALELAAGAGVAGAAAVAVVCTHTTASKSSSCGIQHPNMLLLLPMMRWMSVSC
jgi:hypothetical protein